MELLGERHAGDQVAGAEQSQSYVIDEFDVADVRKEEAGAISPGGTVAVVLSKTRGDEATGFYKRLLLVLRRPSGDWKVSDLGVIRLWNLSVRVFFPQGSEDPAVVVGETFMRWGKLQMEFPDGTKHVAAWQTGGIAPERHVALAKPDGTVPHRMVVGGEMTENLLYEKPFVPGAVADLIGPVRWLGLLGGRLCLVAEDESGLAVFRWTDAMFGGGALAPVLNRLQTEFPCDAVVQESICVVDDHMLAVVGAGQSGSSVFQIRLDDGEWKMSTVPAADVWFGDDRIFLLRRGRNHREIHRFVGDRFDWCAETSNDMPTIGEGDMIIDFGGIMVAAFLAHYADGSGVWKMSAGGSVCIGSKRDLAVKRLHGALAVHRSHDSGEGFFHWESLMANKIGPYGRFPLYGTPFNRLAQVEDRGGKHAMSWIFSEGAVRILRYPLPSR
jgi:hypothetical protein